jgi:neutral ceramidase
MATLRAGAARSCITPRLGSHIVGYFNDRLAADVHDDLFAKALVLDNGGEAIAIVLCDLIALERADVEVARQRAASLSGIPADNIFIACTHTHFGPASVAALGTPRDEAYMEHAMERVADSVKLAQTRLRPAEVGVASTWVHGEAFNRRWRMKDGSVRMNPGYLNPDRVEPAGPTDPQVLVLAVRSLESEPIALLANYSLHYVGSPLADSISADYFGYFDRALQRMAGAEMVGIMANGCCGDINNCDFSHQEPDVPHPFFQEERVANVLAAAAFGAWQGLRGFDYRRDVALGQATETMAFRRRQSTAEELERARRLLAGAREPGDVESGEFANWIYAQEALLVDKEPVERQTPIKALRVGDLGLVGLPGEIFVQYGLQIKAQSPFERTMTIELANDYLGYFPTDKALTEGSYESRLARSAKAACGSEGTMVQAALAALRRVAG